MNWAWKEALARARSLSPLKIISTDSEDLVAGVTSYKIQSLLAGPACRRVCADQHTSLRLLHALSDSLFD